MGLSGPEPQEYYEKDSKQLDLSGKGADVLRCKDCLIPLVPTLEGWYCPVCGVVRRQ